MRWLKSRKKTWESENKFQMHFKLIWKLGWKWDCWKLIENVQETKNFLRTTGTSQNGKIDSIENEEYWKYEIRVYMIYNNSLPMHTLLSFGLYLGIEYYYKREIIQFYSHIKVSSHRSFLLPMLLCDTLETQVTKLKISSITL